MHWEVSFRARCGREHDLAGAHARHHNLLGRLFPFRRKSWQHGNSGSAIAQNQNRGMNTGREKETAATGKELSREAEVPWAKMA